MDCTINMWRGNMRNFVKTQRRRNEPFLDSLPEQMHYMDTGCEASLSCLSCPLPRCKYDDPTWYQAYKRRDRDLELLTMYKCHNLTTGEIASRFGLSQRTVHRAVKRALNYKDQLQAA
ncbi:MAG: sigma-70 family RNA polymerase sigma factor [SAR202 cluster bacterium]|nr:sigma-70 family RNA polymerase sigma factor [SAR202 cluster bacterium]